MVAEERIKIGVYVLHQVDRDPITGLYSNNRILVKYNDQNIVDWDIIHFNVALRTVKVQHKNGAVCVFQLEPDTETDMILFQEKIVNPWNNKYKQQYLGDENYTDYLPAYYKSIESMEKNELNIIR